MPTILDTATSGYELDIETDADKALLAGYEVFLILRDTARADHAPAGSVLSDAVKTARTALTPLAEAADRHLCGYCLASPHVVRQDCGCYVCEDDQVEHDDRCTEIAFSVGGAR